MIKIYLSASTQENNTGVAGYGTEEENMFKLRDRVEYFINNGGFGNKFQIYKNTDRSWNLSKIINDSNKSNVDLHIALHSNAGCSSARGCEVYYHYQPSTTSVKFANILYDEISKVTPTADRGVKKDNVLYPNGLGELRDTKSPAVLAELFFHSSTADVTFYKANVDLFAIAVARAIYTLYKFTFKVQNKTASKLQTWEEIIKQASPKYSDVWITKIKKDISQTGHNWKGLIQKIKDM